MVRLLPCGPFSVTVPIGQILLSLICVNANLHVRHNYRLAEVAGLT